MCRGQGGAGEQQAQDDHDLLQGGPGPWPLAPGPPGVGGAGV